MVRKTSKYIKKAFRPLMRMKKARAMKAVLARQQKKDHSSASTKASTKIKPNKYLPAPIDKTSVDKDKNDFRCNVLDYCEIINLVPTLLKEKKLSIFTDMPELQSFEFKSINSLFLYALMREAKSNNVKRVTQKFAKKLYSKFDWFLPFEDFWKARKELIAALATARRDRRKKVKVIELYNDDKPTAILYKAPTAPTATLVPTPCFYYGTRRERRYARKRIIENHMGKKFDNPKEYKKQFLAQNRNYGLNHAINESSKTCPENSATAYRLLDQIYHYKNGKRHKSDRIYKERPKQWGQYRKKLEQESMSFRAYLAFRNDEDERGRMILEKYVLAKEDTVEELAAFLLSGTVEDLTE